jgi:hypothetical protein
MGYDEELCRLCLAAFNNDVNKSIEYFLENRQLLQSDITMFKQNLNSLIQDSSSTQQLSRPSTSTSASTSNSHQQMREKEEKANELISTLKSEISEDDEAYLDIDIEEDAIFINKYYSLLD